MYGNGIRVTSASLSLALHPIDNSLNYSSMSSNPAQVSNGPDYSRARKACGTVISMEEWLSMNARSVACSIKKRELLNQQIKDAKARERERNLRRQILRELEGFDDETWQPAAGSWECTSFEVPDGGVTVKRYNRYRGGTYRNAGDKPCYKDLRCGQFRVKHTHCLNGDLITA